MQGKKRAAAYIRVSTKSDEQSHSYEFQQYYWQETLSKDESLELVKLYADKGISGRTQAKRLQFMQMLNDCDDGKIDIIFTKSVQRFGRNTTELLSTVRQLRDKGIEVVFEKENIHTFQPNSELYLIMAASIAENDLNTNSLNQKWTYRDKFSKGYVSIGSRILGYKMQPNNTLEIVESEAEIIREIYELYAGGVSLRQIAVRLMAKGYKNKDGKALWRYQSIGWILDNEKYVGDNIQQKTIVIDGVNHNNYDSQFSKQWVMENVHPPIVSRELNDKVKAMRRSKTKVEQRNLPKPHYPFSGIIECGCCGTGYRHKVQNQKKPWACEIWVCTNSDENGLKACPNTRIKDKILKDKFIECYNEFVQNKYVGEDIEKLKSQQQELLMSERELTALKIQNLITQKDFDSEVNTIKKSLSELQNRINKASQKVAIKELTNITEFEEEKLNKFVTKVIVQNKTVTFEFFNGTKLMREYDNGPSGNKKGWNKQKEVMNASTENC